MVNRKMSDQSLQTTMMAVIAVGGAIWWLVGLMNDSGDLERRFALMVIGAVATLWLLWKNSRRTPPSDDA